MSNNAVIFTKVPTAYPVEGEHLKFEKRPFDLTSAKSSLQEGGFITENLYVSIDPYQRGRMRDASIKSYAPPYLIGSTIQNGGVAKVIASKNDSFKEGAIVYGSLDWAEHTTVTKETSQSYRVLENKHDIPLSNYVGAAGMPGMTAYSSFYEIGQPKKGETIFISAASGAVGQIVGQLAKREGLYVVGSAGTDEKVAYLKELGFDAAFNYKAEKPGEALAKYCPKGIDIYFENVGGETLDAVFTACNPFARIIACGMISQYNGDSYGVKNIMQVVAKRINMRGFIVSDFWAKYATEFYENMEKWLKNGDIKYKETIADGLENAPKGFIDMLNGRNFGKAMIRVKKSD